jgi:hypothetical protein
MSSTLDVPRLSHWSRTLIGTAKTEVKRHGAYVIDPIRWSVFPLLSYLTMWLSYTISDQPGVAGANTAGFLLIGMLGLLTWSSTIWSTDRS